MVKKVEVVVCSETDRVRVRPLKSRKKAIKQVLKKVLKKKSFFLGAHGLSQIFRFFFLSEPFPYFPNISQHFQSVLIIVIFSFHSRSRSRPFPGIIASDSRSRILGKFFFIPFPFPNFGNAFFHSLPVPFVPEFWEWIFLFPSRSRTLGMEFSIPVPEPSKVIPAHPCHWLSSSQATHTFTPNHN